MHLESGGIKPSNATRITQLANGDKECVAKGGEEVCNLDGWGKIGMKSEVDNVG
jgi:hypothetical protein